PTRSLMSPISGHSPGIPPRAIRTGSWCGRKAWSERPAARLWAAAWLAALALTTPAATAAKERRAPLAIPESQYIPVPWSGIAGWREDDQLAALAAFRTSCRALAPPAGTPAKVLTKALAGAL